MLPTPPPKKTQKKTKQKVTSGITSKFSKMPQTRAPQFDKLPKRPVSNASYTYASQQGSHSLTIKILTVIIFFFFPLPSAFFPLNFHHPSFPPPFAAFCYKAITLTLTNLSQCLY